MKVSIASKLRNYFIAGVLVLIPIGVTVYLTLFFVKIFSKILPQEINPNNYLPYSIPGLEIVISIIVITVVGWLSLSFLGKKLVKFVNDIYKKRGGSLSGVGWLICSAKQLLVNFRC